MRASPLNIAEKSLRSTILSCLDGSTVKYVADIFGNHETKIVECYAYRVSQKLPSYGKLSPNLDNVVFAMVRNDRWECKVPHCGATFKHVVAIDMHLQAHGRILLTKWYCGDVSCFTGTEKVFNDRAAFDSHIATDHMGSQYSNAAGRRVPKSEVLLTSLTGKLKDPPTQQSKEEAVTGLQPNRCEGEST